MIDKKKVTVTTHGSIQLGRQGENGVLEVHFPQSAAMIGETWEGNHQRSTDTAAYPVALEKQGNDLVWLVTSGDTAIAGTGRFELTCYGSGGEILKSMVYSTSVARSLTTGGEVPDPVKPWYDAIMEEINKGGSGGTVKSVNGVGPDGAGNVEIDTGGNVKTVNGIEPDENGNVEIKTGTTERTEEDVTGDVIDASYVSTKNGAFIAESGYYRTDYIEMLPGDKVYYSGRINNTAGVAGYDADKKFVQSVLSNPGTRVVYTDQELTINADVRYIIAATMSTLTAANNYPLKVIRVREGSTSFTIEDDSITADKLKSEDYILPEWNNFAAFASFTAIGDSLTAGLYPKGRDEDGNVEWSLENAESFCWPYYLSQLTGASFLNYGISGATAKSWCENANGLAKLLAGKKTQAYIIGLGFNDQAKLADDYPLGTTADINTSDYNQNGDTFAGWYGRVIQNILEFNPDAKIFCLHNPWIRTAHGDTCFELIREICQLEAFQGHVYFVDLRKWERFYNAPAVEQHRTGVHYSAAGYCECAKIMLPAISEVMNENPDYFETIPLIEADEFETGTAGKDGADGITPHIGTNGNWYIGDTDTGKPSRGAAGVKGDTGERGPQGATGPAGADGKDGAIGPKGEKGDTGPQGATGSPGADGKTPVKGTDYWTEADKQEMVANVLESLPTWKGGSY